MQQPNPACPHSLEQMLHSRRTERCISAWTRSNGWVVGRAWAMNLSGCHNLPIRWDRCGGPPMQEASLRYCLVPALAPLAWQVWILLSACPRKSQVDANVVKTYHMNLCAFTIERSSHLWYQLSLYKLRTHKDGSSFSGLWICWFTCKTLNNMNKNHYQGTARTPPLALGHGFPWFSPQVGLHRKSQTHHGPLWLITSSAAKRQSFSGRPCRIAPQYRQLRQRRDWHRNDCWRSQQTLAPCPVDGIEELFKVLLYNTKEATKRKQLHRKNGLLRNLF